MRDSWQCGLCFAADTLTPLRGGVRLHQLGYAPGAGTGPRAAARAVREHGGHARPTARKTVRSSSTKHTTRVELLLEDTLDPIFERTLSSCGPLRPHCQAHANVYQLSHGPPSTGTRGPGPS